MCSHVIFDGTNFPKCENGKYCTFCLSGDKKTYYELEKKKEKEGEE